MVNHLSQDVVIPARAQVCELYSLDDIELLEKDFGKLAESGISQEDISFLSVFQDLKTELSDVQVEDVQKLLLKWKSVFSQHDLDLGLTTQAQHHIHLKDDIPFKEKPRTNPPSMFEEVRKHLKEMETLGVIRRSQSPYASNVVIVRKKSGALRFCLDLRILNRKTVPDSYILPCIDSTLDVLVGVLLCS